MRGNGQLRRRSQFYFIFRVTLQDKRGFNRYKDKKERKNSRRLDISGDDIEIYR
jgi:hypothetical protein